MNYLCGGGGGWLRIVSSTHFSTSFNRSSMLFARRSFSYFIQHWPFACSGVSAACFAGAGAGACAGAADAAGGGAAGAEAAISAELLLCAQPPSARAQTAIDASTDFPIMRPS